jgi:Protein of unknown function (DUF4199)
MTITVSPAKTGLRFGIVAAIFYTAALFVLYKTGIEQFGARFNRIIVFAIVVLIGITAGIYQKRKQGGFITLRQGFQTIFTAFLIAEIAYTIFNYLLYSTIDPGLSGKILDYQIVETRKSMAGMQAPQKDIDEMIAVMEQARGAKMSVGVAFQTMMLFLMVWGMISLVVSAVMGKIKRS